MTRSVPDKNWSSRDVALLLLGIFLCVIFSSLLLYALMPVIAERFPDQNNLIIIVFNTFSFQGVAAVLILLFLHNQKMTWKKAFGFCRNSFVTHGLHGILWGLAAFPVSLVLLEALEFLLDLVGLAPETQTVVKMLQDGGAQAIGQVIAIGVLSIIVAPFVEEMLFRGVLYIHIRDMGFPTLAVGVSALIFSVVHGNMLVFIPLVLFAIFLTFLYERYADLTVCIFAHSAFNSANFILALFS